MLYLYRLTFKHAKGSEVRKKVSGAFPRSPDVGKESTGGESDVGERSTGAERGSADVGERAREEEGEGGGAGRWQARDRKERN